jgi:hypothetical protein
MYFSKFSSGTILALLALSGMLFLVPIAAPANATNTMPLTISIPAANPSVFTHVSPHPTAVLTVTVGNPIGNQYGIEAVTFLAPAGWQFNGTAPANCNAAGTTWTTNYGASTTTVTCTAHDSTVYLQPGYSITLTVGLLDAPSLLATVPAVSAIITTSILDTSTSGQYAGPSQTVTGIAVPGAVTVTPAGPITFTAGSAPITFTATVASGQVGVPVVWTTSNKGTFSAATTYTGGSGVTTVVYTPDNIVADGPSTITATVPISPADVGAPTPTVTTVAAAPTSVTFTTTLVHPWTTRYNDTAFGNPSSAPSTTQAEIVGASIVSAPADRFGNVINVAFITAPVCSFAAFGGFFDNGGSAYGTITSSTAAVTCVPAGGTANYNYFQSGTWGTVAYIQGEITGTYNPGSGPVAFTAFANSPFIYTSAFSNTAVITAYNLTPAVGSTTAVKYVLPTPQLGVPITFIGPNSTKPYNGYFVGGTKETEDVHAPSNVTITTSANGTAIAHFLVNTKVLGSVTFSGSFLQATNCGHCQPTQISEGPTAPVVSQVGPASQFVILVAFDSLFAHPTSKSVAGNTLWVDVELTDQYGNLAVVTVPQLQITLATTPVGGLSVVSAYINQGKSDTVTSEGPISWTLASTDTGTATISGIGLYTCAPVTITIVSPNPTLTVTTPVVGSSGIYYSSVQGVAFTGTAKISSGYQSGTLAGIWYSANGAKYASAGATSPWSAFVTLPLGLSTVSFFANDTLHNTSPTTTLKVFVDPSAPVFTIGTPVAGTSSDTVTVTTAEGDFNTTTFAATYGGIAVPASSITWSGTQTLGSPSTLTATINGLSVGTNTLTVSGNSYAGVTGSASASITITIAFANSITFTTSTATYGLVGAFKGVTISVTNNWNTAQTIVVYATLKSGTSIYVADGTVTLAAGATNSVFLVDLLTIPAGSYTVTFAAVTTSNQAVSAPTTPISLTAT